MKRFIYGFLLFIAINFVPALSLAALSHNRAGVESGFIKVNGVKLHYLDWGGKRKTVLFLAGGGHSAYIFGDLAPQLTDGFRVLGLTRRGHGQSEQPATGYDTATLVEDIRQFLDALKIKRVTLIGHSMAGDEMTRFAGLYPDRVDKLVYLDAAYDRSEIRESYILSSLAEAFALAAPTKQDFASIETWRNWLQHKRYGFWSAALEADMQQIIKMTPEGIRYVMSNEVAQAGVKGSENAHPNYTKVKGKVIEMPGVSHFLFIEKQPEVLREIRAFLQQKG